MKRIIIGAAMALVAVAFHGGLASGQESPQQPAPVGVPEQQMQQLIFIPVQGGGGYYCPPLIPGQAVELPIVRDPLAAPYVYQPYPPAQLPQYAPIQPAQPMIQPVQPVQPMPVQAPYYPSPVPAFLGNNAIPLPPLMPGQTVEPLEDRPIAPVPVAPAFVQAPPVGQPAFAPAPTFAPAAPPAGAPLPARTIISITPDQVKQAIAERVPIAIIDVRNGMFRAMDGHIPGDLHVPLGPEQDFTARLAQTIPNRAIPIVFYCRDGNLSARAAALALGAGYRSYLMGAYQGW